ncbi:MAG: hypothetical protein V1765_00365 [bacterium]
MFDRLEKLINFVKKTGEKVVLSDPSSFDDFYVILALKDYEKLMGEPANIKGLTGEELVDKINRDIALWKSQEEIDDFNLNYNDFDLESAETADWSNLSTSSVEPEEEFEEEEIIEEIVDDGFDSIASILANHQPLSTVTDDFTVEEKNNNNWSIPKDRKKKAEAVIDDGQYLEEITF